VRCRTGGLKLLGEEVLKLGGARFESVGFRVGDVVTDRVEIGLHGVDAGCCGTE
jgi:hypothetical protein